SPLMGTDRFVNIAEWREKAAKLGSVYPPVKPKIYESLRIKREPEILVSIIASLYCGGEYIERYLENITSQTIFKDHCELIIIDADSPENEAVTITRYMERYPNIIYHRADSRIGIYEAWNLGVRMAHGRYLTNANMDDLRRFDSFERQAEILEKFPFVDVVYQDFWYSFDGHAPFDKSAATGFKSELPIITPYNLMQSNSPHNAPMWRQELHDAVGMFDDTYRSAGDYDFWLRCAQAGKVFFKINDPHVIYFVNPEGLSTKPNTRGLDEANRSTRLHGRNILSPRLLASDDAFLTEVSRVQGSPIELTESERKTPDWRYLAAQRALRALRVNTAASRNRSSD
ncbi:MAG: glycosyltransferase, partial [Alcaligenaceae bacterium]